MAAIHNKKEQRVVVQVVMALAAQVVDLMIEAGKLEVQSQEDYEKAVEAVVASASQRSAS